MYKESLCLEPSAHSVVAVSARLVAAPDTDFAVEAVRLGDQLEQAVSALRREEAGIGCLYLLQVVRGFCRIRLQNYELHAGPGAVRLLGPGAVGGLRAEEEGAFLAAKLSLPHGAPARVLDERLASPHAVVAVEAELELARRARSMREAVAAGDDDRARERAEAWIGGALVGVGCLRSPMEPPGSCGPTERELCQRAMAFMEGRFSEQLSVEDVASHVFVSSRHLTRIFRRELKTTPGRWLTQIRLEKAKAMLEGGVQACVKGVAYSCGFSNPSYFSARYRERYGVVPSEHFVSDGSE